jgi:epsilon-lactone hydrolase
LLQSPGRSTVPATTMAAATRPAAIQKARWYPPVTHDFHIFWSFLPEAAQALQQAGRFARETTLAAQAG